MTQGIQFLESLGFEHIEAQIYENTLSLGTVPASVIAKRIGIARSSARYTCEQLIKKGLMVGSIKGATKFYTVENPNRLYSFIFEQEEQVKRKREQLSGVIKAFQNLYNPYTTLPKVTYYEGADGIERMLEEIIEKPTNLVSFGAGDYFLDRVPELVERFRRSSAKKCKNVKVIRALKYHDRHEREKDPSRETQYFRTLEELKVDIQIIEDKISICSIAENAPIGVLIKHKEIAETFAALFFELWNALERIKILENKKDL